jgi:long-subunit acyl-CoA synthetase (AMP-forming)
MTETACMAAMMPNEFQPDKVGSCGLPAPLMEMKVVDPEDRALSRGHQGELLLRGPNVMRGYLDNPEATAETFTSDGWLRTGDLAYIDADGFVFLVDRMKELIKVKGLQVRFF